MKDKKATFCSRFGSCFLLSYASRFNQPFFCYNAASLALSHTLLTLACLALSNPDSGFSRLGFPSRALHFWAKGKGSTRSDQKMFVDQGQAGDNVSKCQLAPISRPREPVNCFQLASPRVGSRSVAAPCYLNAAMIRERFPCAAALLV